MTSLIRLIHKLKSTICGPQEGRRLGHLAVDLAKINSLEEMVHIVCRECREMLLADAICLYLLQPEGHFEMACEIGCTEEFKSQWKIMNKDFLPMVREPHPEEKLFFGSADELRKDVPIFSGLLKESGRHTIAYGPLVVNQKVIGILGFSYNREQRYLWDRTFVKLLLNLCALAIDRVRLFEKEQVARRDAESANASKNNFLATISHEIRTPAGVIQGFADVLAGSNDLSAQQQHWAFTIAKNSRQLTEIIGEVLDISKIEANTTEFHREQVNLIDLFEDLRATCEPLARQKSLAITFDHSECSPYVITDPRQLRQILLNVITNAIKFTLHGSVRVEARTSGDRLRIWVTDTGIGVAKDNRDRIFEPFVQAESTTSRRFGGSGLGLSIAKKLARAQGGDLTLVNSVANRGSTFLVEIPYETSQVTEVDVKRKDQTSVGAELDGIDVLLVEDFIDNQELIKYLLEQEGAHVEVADTGKTGVNLALKKSYDVILMDIQMPEMDGYEAVSILRKKGYNRPIAALTAHALRNEKAQSLNKGFDDYLTKPINLPALVDTVKRLSGI